MDDLRQPTEEQNKAQEEEQKIEADAEEKAKEKRSRPSGESRLNEILVFLKLKHGTHLPEHLAPTPEEEEEILKQDEEEKKKEEEEKQKAVAEAKGE